jgi:metallo-beta-lactamase family protein
MPLATLQFLGAAGTVTGSKHLIRVRESAILLDCGLFQGLKPLRLRNWADPPFRAGEIDAVVLSHAHVDHSGYLPLLVRRGFRGSVFCTSGTADLLRVLLLDSAHLQEEEAATANRRGYSKHAPALPLYTTEDAESALRQVVVRRYDDAFDVAGGVRARLRSAGHILGSAFVELEVSWSTRLVFSGDLGRSGRPILRDPDDPPEADILLIESTYGDRVHGGDPDGDLERVVRGAVAQSGVAIVPAFAVGRTQELLWRLRRLEDAGRIPSIPVFLDSPMAIEVTEIYRRHGEARDPDLRTSADDSVRFPAALRLVRTVEESKSLNALGGPMMIIAGSGMATGGRVLHHMEKRLADPSTTILLTGFQAAGTRGRALQQGTGALKMHGTFVPVAATVTTVNGLSAHADREETLAWLSRFRGAPGRTYVVHGEPGPAEGLAAAIRERLRWKAEVAADGAIVALDAARTRAVG